MWILCDYNKLLLYQNFEDWRKNNSRFKKFLNVKYQIKFKYKFEIKWIMS